MVAVRIDAHALLAVKAVLDGQRVEIEGLSQQREGPFVGLIEVEPQPRVRLPQGLGAVDDRLRLLEGPVVKANEGGLPHRQYSKEKR